ncbi:MAG: GntR family transcriptional regulator [Acidobacteriota bacterium]|nr:GntR family transcriptional regulator [Acidobacteriota bacterium]
MALDDDSLSRRVYAQLRASIVSGRLTSGTRLRERNLADELAASRVPIREAILRLEAEGFVQTSPRRGATVAHLHLTDVEELYDVRLALEVQAARLAARRAGGGAATDDLGRALAEADALLSGGDEAVIAEANASVHDRILELAGNRLLTSMMRPVVGRDRWIFGMISAQRNAFRTCQEHHQLCDAIFSGDVELAAALAYAHIEGGRRSTIDALRSILPD